MTSLRRGMQRGVSGQAEETREAIVRCAVMRVAQAGFEGTTLSDVAAAAGLSKGAVTHHFASKDDLVDAVILRCVESMAATMTAALEGAGAPGDRLRALAAASWAAWHEGRDEGRVMAMVAAASLYDPRIRSVGEGAFAALGSLVARSIEEAVAVAGLRPRSSPEAIARWMLGASAGTRMLQGGAGAPESASLLTRSLYAFFEL